MVVVIGQRTKPAVYLFCASSTEDVKKLIENKAIGRVSVSVRVNIFSSLGLVPCVQQPWKRVL